MVFYGVLKELDENCGFENRQEAIIRDIFIINMIDDDIQREFLRCTVEPEEVLSIAVNMEMGHPNQQRNFNNNNGVNVIQQFSQFCGANARVNQQNTTAAKNNESTAVCRGEVVDKIGHRHIVSFALHWVRKVTIVAFSIILQRYVGRNRMILKKHNTVNALIMSKIQRTQNNPMIKMLIS